MKDEFYIGYEPEAPKSYAHVVRWTVIVIGVIAIAVAAIWTLGERGFANSTFELGTPTTIKGTLTKVPVPMLIVDQGTAPNGQKIYESILLVGFGKFGADSIIHKWELQYNQAVSGYEMELEGTLIYYDGKTLLELTKGEKSLITLGERVILQSQVRNRGPVTLEGEIVDPKCYFGVMRPGQGKPHRSCAVRCLSGGIPPVFKVKKAEGGYTYFLLQDRWDESINDYLLDMLGEPVTITGNAEQFLDWQVLSVKAQDIKRLYSFSVKDLSMCSDGLASAK